MTEHRATPAGSDRVDLVVADTNGDGKPDVWIVDTDGNGKADMYQFDTTGDGTVDLTLVDPDEDGVAEEVIQGDAGLPPSADTDAHLSVGIDADAGTVQKA